MRGGFGFTRLLCEDPTARDLAPALSHGSCPWALLDLGEVGLSRGSESFIDEGMTLTLSGSLRDLVASMVRVGLD